MKKIIYIYALFLIVCVTSCDNDQEALLIQKPKSYTNQYYENLRAYKSSEHQVSFGWFSNYTFLHSPGCHFIGLPDSLDICSLWDGIPSDIDGKPNTFFNPLVHAEMRYVQSVKGTRFTYVTIPNTSTTWSWVEKLPEEKRIKTMGDSLLNIINNNDLDGLDLDYEISGCWLHGNNFVSLLQYLGKYIGPKGENPKKLLIVDGWPTNGGYEYMSYFISQAYYCSGASNLQGRYNQVAIHGLEPSRFIVTETIAETPLGGYEFQESNGNTQSVFSGEKLRSIEGMAKWNPEQGQKGGFGGFCIQYDYNNQPGYKYIRMGIQLQNPAKK